jgi:hypothetical protein
MSKQEPLKSAPQNDYQNVTMPGPHGYLIPALKVVCCKCGAEHMEPSPNGLHNPPQGAADKTMRRTGWQLGRNRKNDICPECVEVRKVARDEMRQERQRSKLGDVMPPELIALSGKSPPPSFAIKPNINVVPIKPAQPAAPVNVEVKMAEQAEIEAPREMSRADRRIIIAKIEEVYLDEQTGYSDGWSDQRVANDLGVPRAWVARLREENFGPEASNAATRKLLAEAREFVSRANDRAAQLNTLASDCMKARDAIRLEAERIERQIAAVEKLFK